MVRCGGYYICYGCFRFVTLIIIPQAKIKYYSASKKK